LLRGPVVRVMPALLQLLLAQVVQPDELRERDAVIRAIATTKAPEMLPGGRICVGACCRNVHWPSSPREAGPHPDDRPLAGAWQARARITAIAETGTMRVKSGLAALLKSRALLGVRQR